MNYRYTKRLPAQPVADESILISAALSFSPRIVVSNALECLVECFAAEEGVQFYLYWEFSDRPVLLSNADNEVALERIRNAISREMST